MHMSCLGYVNVFLLVLKKSPLWSLRKETKKQSNKKTNTFFFNVQELFYKEKNILIFIKFSFIFHELIKTLLFYKSS